MIWIVDLEPMETRYTGEWKTFIPKQFSEHFEVRTISGSKRDNITKRGTPFNITGTNIWKAEQIIEIAKLIDSGEIKNGDYFLFTDAWHPGIINLKYMLTLEKINCRIGALWHAGSYDKWDFLGQNGGDWTLSSEKAYYDTIDDNFFATEFHLNMFVDNVSKTKDKCYRVGFPFDYLKEVIYSSEKENIILFPHRISPEKQPDIFKDLSKHFPDYRFIMCQENKLTKKEYHNLLSKSKMVFSANKQETLGITWYEGLLAGAVSLVPDRLSYSEMSIDELKYPSIWTEDFETYLIYKEQLINKIKTILERDNKYFIENAILKLNDFFTSKKLINKINVYIDKNI